MVKKKTGEWRVYVAEVFAILKEHKLRLHTAKYTFGVSSEKFLGHLVIQRGIEANPEQILAINDHVSLRTTKEVQILTRMATVRNRFISKSFDKCRPLFRLLRKNKKQLWNEECEFAYQ